MNRVVMSSRHRKAQVFPQVGRKKIVDSTERCHFSFFIAGYRKLNKYRTENSTAVLVNHSAVTPCFFSVTNFALLALLNVAGAVLCFNLSADAILTNRIIVSSSH
ncbi:hypothetical protein GWI33_020635 [Rhynchophorus ferrugineus]|uniref:Uncharacterized protein n=1 Tax=Rhynchophorus ferrugineus TaxID=354439 RepID=A0A834M083_RHYFE|nr:hypothetical protein GWI33_020635 [Rhynchophorus ferrugineus]